MRLRINVFRQFYYVFFYNIIIDLSTLSLPEMYQVEKEAKKNPGGVNHRDF